jgi:arylsulfatase
VSYVVVTGAALLLVAVYATGVVTVGQGKPVFIYNLLDLKRTTWAGPKLGAGKHTIVFAFTSDGPGLGNGGTGVLSVDGKEVARNSMGHSTPITFPEDESFNLTFNLEPVQEAEADVKHLPAPDASAIGTED